MTKIVEVKGIKIGGGNPIAVIAGPCVVENYEITYQTAKRAKEITTELGMPFIFKSSYKKANRTSLKGFSTIGEKLALEILAQIRKELDIPVLTDIHSEPEAEMAAEYVDVLQIPAFLCRQTELLIAAGRTGKAVNIKKGQFMAPEDMKYAAEKVASTGNEKILLTERGTTFGYHNLVVDMRSIPIMRSTGYPVVIDATHSLQLPSVGEKSGGRPEFIFHIARAAVAVGVDAIFLETHPEPSKALSDSASQLKLDFLYELLYQVKQIDELVKKFDEFTINQDVR
ncbi:2-dehydro-3-deoxyphosphooctonate aldolase (KDO 8-P synthase) [Candidatus Thermokryptus mobilis]|uniref:3-deoxy-8-phosphooctulonate synthase n=1 Tax=Candidatus Thermokryptus mobilis TaxID=1643428 RepID=A0A0S4N5L5_9BACT|nr:3-deoxy-8-phosphooctulonate synthase [Candidatus Thermokryptus mobilis]CUU06492.1 2-dehydro-3-deoxyphosphooctonate aldolase (KDO 8-P synthase) [Candidatus Thermokryptus mobilis]